MHYCKIEQCGAKQLSLGVSERSQNQRFFASHRVTSLTSHLFRFACTAAIAFAGSDRTEQTISGSLKQRGYLWQREWTPAVVDALGEVDRRMNGVVVLGAEINLAGKKAGGRQDDHRLGRCESWKQTLRARPPCRASCRAISFLRRARPCDCQCCEATFKRCAAVTM
jgi:hypothetical protein